MTVEQILAHLAVQIAELRSQLVAVTADRDHYASEVVRLTAEQHVAGEPSE